MPGSWISERITCWADTSSVSFVTKSSHTLQGVPSYSMILYSTAGIPSISARWEAITSLNGSCMYGEVPDFIRQRLPPIIFHLFLSNPSEVLSGDLKSISPTHTSLPNSRSPRSSEKPLSKKLTSSQDTLVSDGRIQ